jgi:hypothetical protein
LVDIAGKTGQLAVSALVVALGLGGLVLVKRKHGLSTVALLEAAMFLAAFLLSVKVIISLM